MTSRGPTRGDSQRRAGRAMRCRAAEEAGSSTVLALGIIAIVLSVSIGALAVLGALRAVHVARSAADLAALAAAGSHQELAEQAERAGPDAHCAQAARIASRQGARVTVCEIDRGGVVTVTTAVPISPRLFGAGPDTAQGRARAGPAPE